jgi:hypothetical protein
VFELNEFERQLAERHKLILENAAEHQKLSQANLDRANLVIEETKQLQNEIDNKIERAIRDSAHR